VKKWGKMVKRIDHVALAVRDLERAIKFFVEGLGGRVLYSMPYVSKKFRWTTIELGNSCLIELIDPLGKDGFVYRFLEKHGEGLNHITIHVDDILKVQKTLEEKEIPTFGLSSELPGWKELFIHPKNAFGTLIQFAEFNPLDWIDPGYIPESYKEFVPPAYEYKAAEKVQVRQVETVQGVKIEIRQGDRNIIIDKPEVAVLIEALNKI